jgi:hypothetical protein
MCDLSILRARLKTVEAWLRDGARPRTGLEAIPVALRTRARRVNAALHRLVRTRRGR